MIITSYRIICAGMLLVSVLLEGCSVLEPPKIEKPVELAPSEPMHVAQPESALPPLLSVEIDPSIALNDGISLYEKGNYNAAIKRLSNALEIWSADKIIQTEALKYMAFSYCVTSRKTLCRQQFEKALKLDPTFDLAPGEKGHPLWTPVFNQVKKQ